MDRKYKSIMDDKGVELTDMLRERVNGMMNLITDILTYSRIDREKSSFQMVNAQDILVNAQENLKSRINENHVVITDDNLSEFFCNRTQMISVFQNLIDNSIKYCEEIPPKIHITMEERKNDWLFKFIDNGIGIDPENNEKIFLIFHQEKEQSSNYSGYGIGLAYCKKIIERHGGKIWIDSHVGKGSTFYFTIKKPDSET
jgi:signal transduction histidine kinase